MKITTVAYSGSNPSMGPHDSPSRRSLSMGPYPNVLEDLLDQTQVNGAASLREYLALRLAGDQEGVRKVHEAYDCGSLNSGERIIDLVFSLQDGPAIALRDLRRFSLQGPGFETFDALIREKGSVSSSGSIADEIRMPSFEDPDISSEISGPGTEDSLESL
tara:strand:+ start:831 stop:1313 length:483 start_codon:yes stop_codon:yes gene_type:complete